MFVINGVVYAITECGYYNGARAVLGVSWATGKNYVLVESRVG